MVIKAQNLDFAMLNEEIRAAEQDCCIEGCLGQRFIAAGSGGKNITIQGVPGNALGAYLSGSVITVRGNAQDAVGDTMNDGKIIVHGNIGDAAGYAMRGGAIFIKGNAGYRAGIHMKAYKEKKPVLVIGGRAGSFLGEYQAGGLILVLGLHSDGKPIVGNFPSAGMHGGKMILRGEIGDSRFPGQTTVRAIQAQEMEEIRPLVEEFCGYFGYDVRTVLSGPYTVITPDSKNPYKQMYVTN